MFIETLSKVANMFQGDNTLLKMSVNNGELAVPQGGFGILSRGDVV